MHCNRKHIWSRIVIRYGWSHTLAYLQTDLPLSFLLNNGQWYICAIADAPVFVHADPAKKKSKKSPYLGHWVTGCGRGLRNGILYLWLLFSHYCNLRTARPFTYLYRKENGYICIICIIAMPPTQISLLQSIALWWSSTQALLPPTYWNGLSLAANCLFHVCAGSSGYNSVTVTTHEIYQPLKANAVVRICLM